MKCNNCEVELEEGVTVCPECGCDNTITEETAPLEEAVAEEITAEEAVEEEAAPVDEETAPAEEETAEPTPIVEGKLSAGKIGMLVVLTIAAIAVVVALIMSGLKGGQTGTETTAPTGETETTAETTEGTVPPDGNPDDVTCKGTYTVSDDEVVAAKDTVVATAGGRELTVGELQVYYWMQFYDFVQNYGDYAAYFGLDFTQPLDTQLSPDGEKTWQQYFLGSALDAWHTYNSMSLDADAAGWSVNSDYANYLSGLAASMEESAVSNGYASATEMLEYDMGKGISVDNYVSYMTDYYTGGIYYSELCDAVSVTDAEIGQYFDDNAATYAQNGLEKNDGQIYADVRHILVMPQGGTTNDDGTVTYSDEEWETCRASAQAILDEWLAGEATEDSFAALANEHSEDPGSNTNGGLYENVYDGQMVEPFQTWSFDAARQYGDTGLVKTDYGYHVMYFVKSTPVWYVTAKNDLLSSRYTAIIDGSKASYPLSVNYGDIVLNTVAFG